MTSPTLVKPRGVVDERGVARRAAGGAGDDGQRANMAPREGRIPLGAGLGPGRCAASAGKGFVVAHHSNIAICMGYVMHTMCRSGLPRGSTHPGWRTNSAGSGSACNHVCSQFDTSLSVRRMDKTVIPVPGATYPWTFIISAWLMPPAQICSVVGLALSRNDRWLKLLRCGSSELPS